MNTLHTWYEDDPFLACQAKQVFYLADMKFGGRWKMVQRVAHRNMYEVELIDGREDESVTGIEPYQEDAPDRLNPSTSVQAVDHCDIDTLQIDDVCPKEVPARELDDEFVLPFDDKKFITHEDEDTCSMFDEKDILLQDKDEDSD